MTKWAISLLALACMACSVAAQVSSQEEADEKFAAEDWKGAVADYSHLLSVEDDNPANWFNLGAAFQQLGDFEAAKDAYLKAVEAGYTPIPRANIRLARVHMSLDDEEAALKSLEAVAESGGPNGRFIQSVAEFAPLADNPRFIAVVKALTPCTDEEFRHFDFWLGEWDVTGAGSATPTAKSKITAREDGCVVLEEYETGSGYRGMSVNFYDTAKEVWHQTWMANNGTPNYLEGRLTDTGAMQLTDAELPISKLTGTINRVTWTPDDKGGVRQYWETSSDGGETWSVGFDGYYSPKKN